MKGKAVLLGMALLLITSIASAQIKLTKKSTLVPEDSLLAINPWSLQYAQNTQTGETLIVWFEWEDRDGPKKPVLVGRIADAEAIKVGKPFTIASETQKSNYDFNCCYGDKLAYNPITNEYLVTYQEGKGRLGKMVSLRLAADGRRLGKGVDITSRFPDLAPYDNKPVSLKFNPHTGGYLQFSLRHTQPAIETTVGFFELLTSKGKPAQKPKMTSWFWPGDFLFLTSGKILMASAHPTPTGVDYGITTADTRNQDHLANLKPEDWTVVASLDNGQPSGGPILELLTSDSPVLYFTDNTNVRGQKISAGGDPVAASFSALNSPAKQKRLLVSTVAFATTPGGVVGMLIALDDPGYPNGPVTVWGQKLNSDGKPAGRSKKLLTTSSTERIETNRIFALPVQPGDKIARFVWYGLNADFFSNDFGVLKLDLSVPLP